MSNRRIWVLGLVTFAFFSAQLARFVISPVVPAITDEFLVGNGSVGLALTGMWVTYALFHLPGGALADRFGERAIVVGALGCMAVGSVVLSLAPTFPLFVAFVIPLGIGGGLYYSASTSLLTKRTEQTGRAIGVHNMGGQVGALAAPVVATAVVVDYGWQGAVLAGAALLVPTAVLVVWWVDPTPPAHPGRAVRGQFNPDRLREFLARPAVATTVLIGGMCAFAWQSTASFLPTFLVEYHGLSVETAGILFSAYFALIAISQVSTGWLGDRLGYDAVLALLMVLGVVGFTALVTVTRFSAILVGVLLVGIAMGFLPPIESRFMATFSDAERGTGFGLVRTLYLLLGTPGSAVVGTVSDFGGWASAFSLLALFVAGSLLLVVVTWRRRAAGR